MQHVRAPNRGWQSETDVRGKMSDAGNHIGGGVGMAYVVIGASAAGVNAAKELRRVKPDEEVILISKDERVYSRCILHHYLSGQRNAEQLNFAGPDFEGRYRINWIKGVECTGLDTEKKEVMLSDERTVAYEKLLIATGSHVFIPPIAGLKGAKNVFGFRSLEDIDQIKTAAEMVENIVILGGGLVGIDALTGLLERGKNPVLVEMVDHLLGKQLDHKSAATYQTAYEKEGVSFYLGIGVEKIETDEADEICAVILSDGTKLLCEMLILTAGVRANVEFLEGSGVETDKFGLLIDEAGRTNIPDVYGAGDVTGRSPIWPAAVKQGIVAADNMGGTEIRMTDFFASKSTMNFMGIATMSLGNPEAPDNTYKVEIAEDDSHYKKIIHKDGKIVGAILQGDLSYSGVLTQLIAREIDISKVRKPLFKIDYSDFFREDDDFQFYYEGE